MRSLGAFVLAVTRSTQEFMAVSARRDLRTAWGVGIHPGLVRSIKGFDADGFRNLVRNAAFVGEVGLDGSSRVPLKGQIRVFRGVLEELQRQPRLVSVHSSGAHFHVMRELYRTPIDGVILHWWNGSPEFTEEAVRTGCHFSLPPAMMSSTQTLRLIPLDHILPETDHPYGDLRTPGRKRPGGVAEVEQRIGELYGHPPLGIRIQFWKNLRALLGQVHGQERLGAKWMTTFDHLD